MKNLLTRLTRWPRLLFRWLLHAWLPFFCTAIVAMALAVPLFYWHSEQSIRISGLLLQLFGIGAAAIGIRDTRRMFGKPSFLQSVRNWLRSIPGIKARVISGSAASTLSASATFKADVWHGPGNDPTIESRVLAAEKNLMELSRRVSAAESAIDEQMRSIKESLRQERDERLEHDRQLDQKIEAASTDGLHLAAVGAVWLACGVVMSTMPSELFGLLVR